MADPFVAEIRIFPFNFTPRGWATCDGQLMPISQNTALFSLLGTTYGGDGRSTFALPDLQGSVPIAPGQGPGLSLRDLGERAGATTVSLLESEMPVHSHSLRVSTEPADIQQPTATTSIARPVGALPFTTGPGNATLAVEALAPAGGDQPHNNMMPYLAFQFCIALQGVFPPRT